jgi:hypothetical protein
MSNCDNPINGRIFQEQVKTCFENKYHRKFYMEQKLPIGIYEKKLHRFDIVDEHNSIAVECKCIGWTESGNVPSAKMGACNEAAFYLYLLPDTYEKFIVIRYSTHPKRSETLAEYYYRTNKHLLGKTRIAEYNPENNTVRII